MTKIDRKTLLDLREIGWREWDPLGILRTEKSWVRERFADEYDPYLKEAARRIGRDGHIDDASDYLARVESRVMELADSDGSHARSRATAEAILALMGSLTNQR